MDQKSLITWLLPITFLFAGPADAFNPLEALDKAIQGATEKSKRQQHQAEQRRQAEQQRQASAPTSNDLGIAMAGKRQIVYEGYTKEMLPVKELMAKGKLTEALQAKKPKDTQRKALDMLAHLELGVLAMDAGALNDAKKSFGSAERKLGAKDDRSKVGGFFSGAKDTLLATLTGNAELGEYPGAGYERVLILNCKSIAHLLDGERSAYNVTRRAIDLQNLEKEKFDELVRKAKTKIKKTEDEQKEKGAELASYGLDTVIEEQYESTKKQALRVSSAFVNPFGFYFAGMVQELDSYEDKSLRDNARISYKKALELNPRSAVIKRAVKDMHKPAPSGRRLVNVIIADGFSPEKKLLKFDLSLGASLPTPVELPIYQPVKSLVQRIEIQTTSGKRWATASEVANITALALRYQKDSGPIQQLRMMTTVIRNIIEGTVWNQAEQSSGLLGSLIGKAKKQRDEMVHPDMRSWSTLPSRLLAARFFVPKSVSRIKIVAYDAKGKRLSSRLVGLEKNSHNFVYVRILDKTLYASSSKKMWVGS